MIFHVKHTENNKQGIFGGFKAVNDYFPEYTYRQIEHNFNLHIKPAELMNFNRGSFQYDKLKVFWQSEVIRAKK